ncbi:response regulator transcription factor [Streptomyces sp. NPDC048248]|uniref:response regulator transcription factor n=1 Tax=Streptomyces sp. NPDC048248 TaxID=3365523 RepID=UPI003713D66B
MRLLLVEDDDHVAAALSAVLAKHGVAVVHARSGEEALQALLPHDTEPFAVVLLDLGLPDQDGFEVCGRIRKLCAIPVIMVTARSDVRSRIHGLNLGADDYVVKPYDTGELLARIHAVSRRNASGGADQQAEESAGGGDALRLGPVSVELATRQVSVDGTAVPLTRKEFDLLALLAQRPGVVFRREQIISEVWRTSWEGTGRTLEVHIASLRAKLRMPALIETVRGVGYRLVVPAPAAPGPPPASPAS